MNDTPKYTPGPWLVGFSCDGFRTVTDGTKTICTVGEASVFPVIEADARLIAAAPALLDKLAQAVERLRYLTPERFDDDAHEKEWNRLLVEIDETIAKAEGRLLT